MDKNIHFVNTKEYYNEDFRIYDICYLSDNIFLSSDIIGQLIYYEISEDNFDFKIKETKQIYSTDDLDNLISIYSIDTLNNDDIILGSSKGEVVYLKNNSVEEKYTNSNSDKFSKVKFISENIFSAGDFNGKLTLFDKRQKSPLKIFKEQSEEITDILYEPNKSNFLLSSSIDSTLCVYDINKLSLYALSDKLDEELNCLMSNKNGNYILCGSGEGNILIFNWDWFGDFKDMIKGHPEGINDMDKYDDNIFFTGAEDGLVRICTMNPKGVRGILKNKDKKGGNKNNMKDVNKIKISYDKKKVITCSGIDCLRIFNISEIEFDKIYKPIDQLDSEEDIEKDNKSNPDNLEEENKDKKENEKKKEKIKKEKEENEESEEDDDDIKEMENEEEEDDEEGEEMEDDNEIEENEEEEEEEESEEKMKKEKSKKENENEKLSDISEDINDIKLLNKKRKKQESESEPEEKDKSEKNDIENSDKDSDSDSDSDDSSSTKKKKSKKVKKIGKKTKSLIAKEERKAFFNDL